jgi:hypothetical protein
MELSDNYPLYRKYGDNKTFFKITSGSSFEELKILGIYYSIHHFEAKILPDRNFLSDLISCGTEGIIEISESIYQDAMINCIENLKKVEF